jgi:hypothetical protein
MMGNIVFSNSWDKAAAGQKPLDENTFAQSHIAAIMNLNTTFSPL